VTLTPDPWADVAVDGALFGNKAIRDEEVDHGIHELRRRQLVLAALQEACAELVTG
jgi:hypothetical protein